MAVPLIMLYEPVNGESRMHEHPVLKLSDAERAAGVTPVNYAYEPGNWMRYGADPTGVTDSSTAINNSIKAAGALGYRGRSYGPAGIYKVTSSIVPGTPGSFVQIEIVGDGPSTQVVNACPASTPSFDGSGVCGWKVRNMSFTGNSANLNDGVLVDGTSNVTVRWELDRVVVAMPGRGFVLKNTNTGTLRNCKSWPSGENFNSAPVYNASDIDHHIFMTGGFVHDITIIDFEGLPLSTYKVNQAALRCNATNALTLRVIGGVWQCDNNTRYAFNCTNLSQFAFIGPYVENALINFDNCQGGVVSGLTSSGIGGSFQVTGSSQNNMFTGVQMDTLFVDSTSWSNTFIGCSFGNSFTDNAVPINRYIGCLLAGSTSRYPDVGERKRLRVTQSGGGTKTINAAVVGIYQIQVNDTAAFAVAAPTNPFDGMLLDITIRNNSGGVMGVITWNAVFHMTAWTNPASGTNRTVSFYYDSTSALWFQRCATGADIGN